MDEWEYLRISVYYKEDDTIDFISKKGKTLSNLSTHEGMITRFNVEAGVLDAYLLKLKNEGWEMADFTKREDGRHEAYSYKRLKN